MLWVIPVYICYMGSLANIMAEGAIVSLGALALLPKLEARGLGCIVLLIERHGLALHARVLASFPATAGWRATATFLVC
jgi:hypothetical protein